MPNQQERTVVRWTSFPAAENKLKAVLVAAFLVVLLTFIHLSFGTAWFVIAFLLLGGSVAPYFAVTRYEMTESEITVFHFFFTTRKPWSVFRSYYVDKRGVLLSPFARPSRLENYRGLYLRFGESKDEVLRFVRKMVDRTGAPEAQSPHAGQDEVE